MLKPTKNMQTASNVKKNADDQVAFGFGLASESD